MEAQSRVRIEFVIHMHRKARDKIVWPPFAFICALKLKIRGGRNAYFYGPAFRIQSSESQLQRKNIDKLQKGQTSKTVTTRKAHASDVRNNAMAKASDVTPDFQGLWDHMTQRGKHPVLMTI